MHKGCGMLLALLMCNTGIFANVMHNEEKKLYPFVLVLLAEVKVSNQSPLCTAISDKFV
jgi:hypothetical protein